MFFSFLFLFLTTFTSLRSTIRESSTIQVQVFFYQPSSSATISISSDPYQLPSEKFSTVFQAEPVLFFLAVMHGNLMFSLATEGRDSSRGSQPPRQLDLAQSFNDMHISRSSTSTGDASNKLPSRSRSSQPRRQFSAHHPASSRPISSVPTCNFKPPSSQRGPHPSEPFALLHHPTE